MVDAASSLTAYRWLFAVCAVASVAAAALVLTIPSPRRQPTEPEPATV